MPKLFTQKNIYEIFLMLTKFLTKKYDLEHYGVKPFLTYFSSLEKKK